MPSRFPEQCRVDYLVYQVRTVHAHVITEVGHPGPTGPTRAEQLNPHEIQEV